jgi:DNA repair exonuclease SbcCD nuclease subunit
MSFLIISDTHFTDSVKDEYRWGLFPWMIDQVRQRGLSQVLLLGDVTEHKDAHPSSLVNKLIGNLTELSSYCDVFILRGNHDGISEDQPFFGFIEDFQSNVTFISKKKSYRLQLGDHAINCLFLPSTKNWHEDWDGIDFNEYDLIFTHQTYDGAKAETGIALPGIPPSLFKDYRGRVFSGDIHVPQKLLQGKIEYVGAPYRIRFGDAYRPRVILYDDDATTRNLYYNCLSKHTLVGASLVDLIDQANKLKIREGDQVKIRISLSRAELPEWIARKAEIKELAAKSGWELVGIELTAIKDKATALETSAVYKDSEEILADFIKAKRLSQRQAEIGLSLIKGA